MLEDEGWPALAAVGCFFAWDVAHDRVEWSRCDGVAQHSTQAVFLAAVHPDDRAGLTDAIARSLADRAPFRCDVRVHGDRWISGRGEPRDARVRGALVDVTDDRRFQIAIGERERWSRLYTALTRIHQAIVATASEDELFANVCRALGEHGGFRMSWIGIYEPATRTIAPVASWGDDSDYLGSIRIRTDDVAEGRGPTGTAFREGRKYISNDLLGDPACLPWRDQLARRGFRASAVLPIRQADEVRGTLTVYAGETDFFGAQETALLEEAARDVSFALDNFARERERRRAEDTLRRERDFSNAVVHSLPGVLYLYDEQRRFLRWNENFERVTGYTATEIATLDPLAVISVATRAEVARRIGDVFATGAAAVDAELLAKDGTTTPYHFTGVRTLLGGKPCLIGVGIDLSAQRAADARYRTLFDYAPDAILIADHDSRYIDANPGAGRMFGYPPEEIIGMNASDVVVPEQFADVAPALREILSAHGYHREWAFRRKDGSVFPGDVIATVMPDGNLLALIRDITARKEAERAVRDLNENLERGIAARTQELREALVRAEAADRLKSAFLATMSHELRTPLNSIIGFTGILHQGMAGPVTAEQVKQLGMVRASARHLLELINDVLDISKIEADQLQVHATAFGFAELIERAVASVLPLATTKGLSVDARVDPAVDTIVSDRRRVEQILLNLLNNAIKFTDAGGVTITVDRIEAAVPNYRVRVRDTGIGIKPEDLGMLFQPFRQIDTGLARLHEGTGLGLAICRRLATLLGGEIAVASTWGQGSELTLILPVTGRSS